MRSMLVQEPQLLVMKKLHLTPKILPLRKIRKSTDNNSYKILQKRTFLR